VYRDVDSLQIQHEKSIQKAKKGEKKRKNDRRKKGRRAHLDEDGGMLPPVPVGLLAHALVVVVGRRRRSSSSGWWSRGVRDGSLAGRRGPGSLLSGWGRERR
jgi:hypothetical protein